MISSEKKIRVLLIDDDEEDFILTQDILSDVPQEPFTLSWVPSPREGMAALTSNEFDIYLIDYHLGIHNGLELIQKARLEGCKGPIILLTGQNNYEIDQQALRAGAADYLVKGEITPQLIERSLRYSLRHNQDMRKIHNLNSELEERVISRTRELENANRKLEGGNLELQEEINQRQAATMALEESQKLYRAISENFPEGFICVLESTGKVLFIEGRELLLFEKDPKELVEWNVTNIQAPSPIRELLPLFEMLKKEGNSELETKILNNNYNVTGVPLINGDGETSSYLTVVKNITSRKQAELEIRKTLEKERELNEMKTRFVSMASHEFRTPLSTILSSVTLIGKYEEPELAPRRKKHIDRIKSSVKNLTEILNEFLSLGRLEEGVIKTIPENFDLVPFFHDIRDQMQGNAKAGQIITLKTNYNSLPIYLDKQLITNILNNLLSNAIKYSPENSTVHMDLEIKAKTIVIKIKDEGMGIPKADQPYLFGRFFRAHNVSNIQGTGLGLNIVKKYLDILGGKINFVSEEKTGTTFTISLPFIKSN